MPITEVDALAAARRVAQERGWAWKPPFVVSREQNDDGRWCWQVSTNCDHPGDNVDVDVDEATGEILDAAYHAE